MVTETDRYFRHVFTGGAGDKRRRVCPRCTASVKPYYETTIEYAPDSEHEYGYRIEIYSCDCGYKFPEYLPSSSYGKR